MNGKERAWASGIFDGEGSVAVGFQRGSGISRRLVVEMNHRHTVRHLHYVLDKLGTVRVTSRGTCRWEAVGREAAKAASRLIRYSLTKHKQLELFLSLDHWVESRPRGHKTPKPLMAKYKKVIKDIRKANRCI